ncbi:hypothetical protein AMS68_005805 [Peltaster fructicola]|uniref:Tr-type G domain-containing protein n=1 Tax=Peltaster fructicola TaxID=286661 RepID=A0A6H0Y0C0_9PEZI|nr:hypothetical protein AMS68_005805 [Peltaster fructicola]
MASIFTWESDTPRVSSPWLQNISDSDVDSPAVNVVSGFLGDGRSQTTSTRITRLQAEPQEGPVEYKLHLLLRPRRKFKLLSTGAFVAGSQRSDTGIDNAAELAQSTTPLSPAHPATTQQTRQHRLQQLTTQLLWRLQQSSPHHTSSATNYILPTLPEALPELQAPQQPGKLLHGLEESQGALYEIGVSDDGTLVGLAEDELQESLNNLSAMAACLGCTVEVLRKQAVGHCEWVDLAKKNKKSALRRSPLFVAEALVKPHLQGQDAHSDAMVDTLAKKTANLAFGAADQLRLTLTGPTMSGKSTLLGTLTTSTLDTGRGKSRLSLFKHRHEITSGITSSVTQELFGYQDSADGDVEVVNYATENVASWIDIHAASADCRLVFVSDSAGHPRYRRTTVRSLVGWAPHWTLFCIPANEADDAATTQPEMDVAGSQLDLCLRLKLPLVVVITKLDLASRTSLRTSLTKVLDALKAAGRKASIFPNAATDQFVGIVESALVDKACDVVVPLLNDAIHTVPIVLTSAVQGTGIRNLHALLHELPIPIISSLPQRTIYHVEDVYSKPAEVAGIILSGHLRSGEIVVGDEMVLGPFTRQDLLDDSDSEDVVARRASTQLTTSRSFPGALHVRRGLSVTTQNFVPGQEWKRFSVSSIRNLRLPSHSLLAGQVGTIAIVPCDSTTDISSRTTEFDRQDLEAVAVGNHVVLYIASIRASAKILCTESVESNSPSEPGTANDAPFDFEDDVENDQKLQESITGVSSAQRLHVTFAFESGREFVMLDDKVLVMPGGGPSLTIKNERGRKGIAGLDGFVGRIVELLG